MKKIISSLMMILFIVSCESIEEQITPQSMESSITANATAGSPTGTLVSGSRTTYEPWPRQGRPEQTEYVFTVHDKFYSWKNLSVRFTNLSGYVVIEPMFYEQASESWVLRRQLSSRGRVKVEYVYTSSNYQVYQSPDYWVDNTLVEEASYGSYSLYWPFGADGSNYNNRNGWYFALESGSCGGWGYNEGTHQKLGSDPTCSKADDRLAQDWNRCGNNDDGTWFVAPVDGKVVYAGKQNTVAMRDFGYRVDIVQELGDKKLMFRIAHLQNGSIPAGLVVGSHVLGGISYLGKVGGSGQTDNSYSPHAHCVLYEMDANNCTDAREIVFNAN